jgi:hypothetical protein
MNPAKKYAPLDAVPNIVQGPVAFAQVSTERVTKVTGLNNGLEHRDKAFQSTVDELTMVRDVIHSIAS